MEKELVDLPDEEVVNASDEAVVESAEPISKGVAGDDGLEKPAARAEKEPDYKKLSSRETIKDAFRRQKEKEDANKPQKKEAKEVVSEAKDTDVESPKVDKETRDSKPPPGWTKEAKALWDALPTDIKKSVAKREKEVSDGFAQYGKSTEELKELNSVFSPRENELRQLGVSKAQIVDRLFQWVDALSSPNKLNALLELGRRYGVSDDMLRQYYGVKGNQNPQNAPAQNVTQPNQEVLGVKQELETFKQQIAAQQQAEADNFLANWANDKPHYQTVRQTMVALFQSGALRLQTEKDLDEAYARACNADPTIRAQLDADKEAEREQAAQQAAQKKEAERLARLSKARQASSSIKSGSPGIPTQSKSSKPSERVSVAESLRMALQELRASE